MVNPFTFWRNFERDTLIMIFHSYRTQFSVHNDYTKMKLVISQKIVHSAKPIPILS